MCGIKFEKSVFKRLIGSLPIADKGISLKEKCFQTIDW